MPRPVIRELNVMSYQLLADVILVLHFVVVLFIVGGLVVVVAGNWLGWRWVNGWWFRLAHLAAAGIVASQALLGQLCPLTVLESWLRVQTGQPIYTKSFIEHWLQRIIFYEAPFWVFALAYSVFAVIVIVAWWYFPPTRKHHRNDA